MVLPKTTLISKLKAFLRATEFLSFFPLARQRRGVAILGPIFLLTGGCVDWFPQELTHLSQRLKEGHASVSTIQRNLLAFN